MTTGSKVFDRSPLSYYSKTWSGTNYASSVNPETNASWRWIPIPARGKYGPKVKWVYRKIRLPRSPKPKRSKVEDHPYSMSLTWWAQPRTMRYTIRDFYPPHDILSEEEKYFRVVYGDGYTSNFASGLSANDEIALIGKLREKVVGSDFDLSVFLGEGRESLKLITSTATRLYQYYRAFRHLDVKEISRSLGTSEARVARAIKRGRRPTDPLSVQAAQVNLELQYGWMPLVQDMSGGAQALAQQLNNPAVQTYRARLWKPMTATVASANINDYMYEGRLQAQLIGRLKEVDVIALNGLMDPSSVLWELTPWSFVLDWAIPIGNYLSARGFANAVSGTFVKTITRTERFHAESGTPKNTWYETKWQPEFMMKRVQVDRTVSSSISVPLPRVKTLAEIPSWKRSLNAVSLLVLQARSLGKSWSRKG